MKNLKIISAYIVIIVVVCLNLDIMNVFAEQDSKVDESVKWKNNEEINSGSNSKINDKSNKGDEIDWSGEAVVDSDTDLVGNDTQTEGAKTAGDKPSGVPVAPIVGGMLLSYVLLGLNPIKPKGSKLGRNLKPGISNQNGYGEYGKTELMPSNNMDKKLNLKDNKTKLGISNQNDLGISNQNDYGEYGKTELKPSNNMDKKLNLKDNKIKVDKSGENTKVGTTNKNDYGEYGKTELKQGNGNVKGIEKSNVDKFLDKLGPVSDPEFVSDISKGVKKADISTEDFYIANTIADEAIDMKYGLDFEKNKKIYSKGNIELENEKNKIRNEQYKIEDEKIKKINNKEKMYKDNYEKLSRKNKYKQRFQREDVIKDAKNARQNAINKGEHIQKIQKINKQIDKYGYNEDVNFKNVAQTGKKFNKFSDSAKESKNPIKILKKMVIKEKPLEEMLISESKYGKSVSTIAKSRGVAKGALKWGGNGLAIGLSAGTDYYENNYGKDVGKSEVYKNSKYAYDVGATLAISAVCDVVAPVIATGIIAGITVSATALGIAVTAPAWATVALGVAVAAGVGYGCTKLLFDWKPFGEGKNKKSVKDVCCEGVEKAWNWLF